jgi:hypothetical protein
VQNFEAWVDKNLPKDEKSEEYKHHFAKIRDSKSIEKYTEELSKHFELWPEKLVKYYETYIDKDFLTSARWILERFHIYSFISGISNNPAESLNHSVKRVLNNKQADFQKLAYTIYFLSVKQIVEFSNGFEGKGELKLENVTENVESLQFSQEVLETVFSDYIDQDQIEDVIFNGMYYKSQENKEREKAAKIDPLKKNPSMKGLAEIFIKEDRIDFIPQRGIFIVKGLQGRHFIVTLGDSQCSCTSRKMCAHLLAVQKSSGLGRKGKIFKTSEVYNLGQLFRDTVDKRSGKKGKPLERTPKFTQDAAAGKIHPSQVKWL